MVPAARQPRTAGLPSPRCPRTAKRRTQIPGRAHPPADAAEETGGEWSAADPPTRCRSLLRAVSGGFGRSARLFPQGPHDGLAGGSRLVPFGQMSRTLEDAEIARLLKDQKPVPQDWRNRLQPRGRRDAGHRRRSLTITTETGDEFRVDTRQSAYNHLDFSIILTFIDHNGVEYRLLRCNGMHASRHTNRIERDNGQANAVIQSAFHVHMATERYQAAGHRIDGYAEETQRYTDFQSALEEFSRLTNLVYPTTGQMVLI